MMFKSQSKSYQGIRKALTFEEHNEKEPEVEELGDDEILINNTDLIDEQLVAPSFSEETDMPLIL